MSIKKCPECQFESTKHGTYEYTPHAPGCSKAKIKLPELIDHVFDYDEETSTDALAREKIDQIITYLKSIQ